MTDSSAFDNLEAKIVGLLVDTPPGLRKHIEQAFHDFRVIHQGRKVLVPRKITEAEKEAFKAMIDAGHSISYAARTLGLPVHGIVRQRANFLG